MPLGAYVAIAEGNVRLVTVAKMAVGLVCIIIEVVPFFNQRMLRHLAVADDIFGTGNLVGKNLGNQILRLHALQIRRNAFAGTP